MINKENRHIEIITLFDTDIKTIKIINMEIISKIILIYLFCKHSITICPPSKKNIGRQLNNNTITFKTIKTYMLRLNSFNNKYLEIIIKNKFTVGPQIITTNFFHFESGYPFIFRPKTDASICGLLPHKKQAMICPDS